MRAQQVRSAVVTGKALTDEESDALELELPVNIPGVKLSQARGGALAAGSAAAFDLTFPAKVQPGSRLLGIRISPSIAGSLFGALDYLTTFPYGCVEQTMSSFLPNIVVTQAVNELGLKVSLDTAARAAEDSRGNRPAEQLPARRRRLGLVGDGREPSVHDGVRGGGPGAGQGRRRAGGCRPDRERREVDCQDVRRGPEAGLRPARLHAVRAGGGGRARCRRAGAGLRTAREALAVRTGDSRPGVGDGEGRSRGGDRGRAGAGGAAGCRAGMVAGGARPDAGFLRRRDARGDGVRGEVPLPSASRFRAAAQGGAVADESSQRRLLVEQHQADRDGDLRADRLPEGDRRTESESDGDGAGERCAGAHEEARSGGGARCCRN